MPAGNSPGSAPDRNTIYASADTDYTYSTRHEPYPVDITGPWRDDYKWHVTVDDLEPKPTPFTAEGRQVFEATEPWHDYALRCMAMGLPRVFGAPYNMDIIDAGSHYFMLYLEHNSPRRVWMDGRTLPSPVSRSEANSSPLARSKHASQSRVRAANRRPSA